MKKEFFLGIVCMVVILLFITSCVPVLREYVCYDGSKVSDPNECPPVPEEQEDDIIETEPVVEPEDEEEEEEEEEEEVIMGVITEDAQALFNKIDKVNSMQYAHVLSPKALPDNIYSTSRTNMKIKLKTKVRFTPRDSFDTVYLNMVRKTAVAFCEDTDRQTCPDRDKEYEVDFDDYYIETPYDWVNKLTSAELTGRSQRIENRNAEEVKFEINGVRGIMYVDSFFGIPMEIHFKDDKYEFRNLFTQIPADELEHQFNV